MLPYQNPQLPVEDRLDDLISRMTLEELIMQTDQFGPGDVMEGDRENWTLSLDKAREMFHGHSIGAIGPFSPAVGNALQRWAVEETRLGIPLLFNSEGVHGASINGSTIMPQQIGLASSFEPELAKKMGRVILSNNVGSLC